MSSSSFDRLTPAGPRQGPGEALLVLTKANSRATVHRAAYLDYIGVKQFDADGKVVGERRFLGLFSSSAYTDSVRRCPWSAARWQRSWSASGFAPDSHSGKDLLADPRDYPRDELFEISVDDLYSDGYRASCTCRSGAGPGSSCGCDAYGRYCPAGFTCPGTATRPPVRLGWRRSCARGVQRRNVDYSARVSEKRAGPAALRRPAPAGRQLPAVDRDELEAELVEATRSWDEDLGDALRSELGEEEAARLLRGGERVPRADKEDFPARVAVADLRRVEDLA